MTTTTTMGEEEHRKKKAEEDKSTPQESHKRRRKSPSSSAADGKDDKSSDLPFPTPNSRVHYTFVNSNVTINQSKRPATTGSGSPTVKEEAPPVPEKSSPAKTSADTIKLKFTDQDGNEVSYRVKRATPLSNVLEFYNEHHNLEKGTVKLLFDGRYCHGHQTPDVMGIEDGDEISVVTEQDGGS
ncbi:hypothetical protein V2J09_017277 [Rumex salicifolius]